MYNYSPEQIELSGFVSNKFPIKKGTEPGQPLLPHFFKIYINDLSSILDYDDCPKLLDALVSHLLWADDLIILALDPFTPQKQLDGLDKFCSEWGIEINPAKTKLMKFQPKGDIKVRDTNKFKIG